MQIKKILVVLFVMAVMPGMIPVNKCFAHKVIIFAWVENGMIYTQSSFGSKRKAKACAITVVDENGIVVHNGLTDQEGHYSFKIPENIGSDLVLTLEAGTGHKAQWTLPKQELAVKKSEQERHSIIKEKENLEKGPSLLNITTGIAIIFFLAMVIRFIKRKKF